MCWLDSATHVTSLHCHREGAGLTAALSKCTFFEIMTKWNPTLFRYAQYCVHMMEMKEQNPIMH